MKSVTLQRGFMLIELMICITLAILLLSGMFRLFSTNLTIWTKENHHSAIEQTARIAIDKIMREIRYARSIRLNDTNSLTIIKISGEINTFQLGSGTHAKTLYMIIDKTAAIPAGGISANPITENIVTSLLFTPYPEAVTIQAVGITIEVTDQSTGEKQTFNTAGYFWNQ